MKLNLDCMRDVLLTLEQFNYGQLIHHEELEELLSSTYSEADTRYTLSSFPSFSYNLLSRLTFQ